MAFQRVPNGIKIELNQNQGGVPVVNVHYVQMAGAPTDADLEACADVIDTWWSSFGRNVHSSSLELLNITCTDVNVEAGHQFVKSDITDPSGTVAGAATAANGAAVISWRTANTGRSFRGRTYIGGIAQANLADAHTLDSSMVTALATMASEFIDALEGIGATLVVVSRFVAGVLRVTALATEIINIIVDSKVDSQRRRTAN